MGKYRFMVKGLKKIFNGQTFEQISGIGCKTLVLKTYCINYA